MSASCSKNKKKNRLLLGNPYIDFFVKFTLFLESPNFTILYRSTKKINKKTNSPNITLCGSTNPLLKNYAEVYLR